MLLIVRPQALIRHANSQGTLAPGSRTQKTGLPAFGRLRERKKEQSPFRNTRVLRLNETAVVSYDTRLAAALPKC